MVFPMKGMPAPKLKPGTKAPPAPIAKKSASGKKTKGGGVPPKGAKIIAPMPPANGLPQFGGPPK